MWYTLVKIGKYCSNDGNIFFVLCNSKNELKKLKFERSKNQNQQICFISFGPYLWRLTIVHQCNIWHASCVAFYSFQLNLDYELQSVSILMRIRVLKKVSKFQIVKILVNCSRQLFTRNEFQIFKMVLTKKLASKRTGLIMTLK